MKLILTNLDGTFLNSKGEYDRLYFKQTLSRLKEKKISIAMVTGKQVQRVEELLGEWKQDVWILGDSASRISYKGEMVYESLIPNALAQDVINTLV